MRCREPGRARYGRRGLGLATVVGDRPGVPHRPVQGRAVRAEHRHPGRRRPVQPRQRRRPRRDRHQPRHRADHDHERPAAAAGRRRPAADQNRQRHDRSSRIHLQPDQLRRAGGRRHDLERPALDCGRVEPLCCDRLREPAVQADVRCEHAREGQQSRRSLAGCEGHLRDGAGKHRQGQGGPPQAAPLAPDDAAKGMFRSVRTRRSVRSS